MRAKGWGSHLPIRGAPRGSRKSRSVNRAAPCVIFTEATGFPDSGSASSGRCRRPDLSATPSVVIKNYPLHRERATDGDIGLVAGQATEADPSMSTPACRQEIGLHPEVGPPDRDDNHDDDHDGDSDVHVHLPLGLLLAAKTQTRDIIGHVGPLAGQVAGPY